MHDTPLPVHSITGLSAIGWRKARRGEDGDQPIWPVLGASDDAGDGGTDADTETETDEDREDDAGDGAVEGEDALGDAGKRALDKMKADLKAEKARRKAAESDLAAARASTQQDAEADAERPDLDKLRAQALEQARAETLRDRALDRLEARAAKRFKDSADARAHLGGRIDEFIDGGQIDNTAIDEALDELLASKSYLAATATNRFVGTGDGGARKGSAGPVQLTDADLKKMTAEQIDEAHRKGQFDELLGTKR